LKKNKAVSKRHIMEVCIERKFFKFLKLILYEVEVFMLEMSVREKFLK
jgi:hypothetical protein